MHIQLQKSLPIYATPFGKNMPNLSNFDFDDIKNCPTCIKANMRKNSASK